MVVERNKKHVPCLLPCHALITSAPRDQHALARPNSRPSNLARSLPARPLHRLSQERNPLKHPIAPGLLELDARPRFSHARMNSLCFANDEIGQNARLSGGFPITIPLVSCNVALPNCKQTPWLVYRERPLLARRNSPRSRLSRVHERPLESAQFERMAHVYCSQNEKMKVNIGKSPRRLDSRTPSLDRDPSRVFLHGQHARWSAIR